MARILGKMLAELKVLPKGHLIEVERADLVGELLVIQHKSVVSK